MKKIILLFILAVLFSAGVPKAPAPAGNEMIDMLETIKLSCHKTGFSFRWAYSIFHNEHSGIKNINQACSHGRTAYGVGGMLYSTAKQDLGYNGKESGLNDYTVSIPLCVQYLKKLHKAYRGDMQKVISHYITGKPDNFVYYERVKKIYDTLEGIYE